jgi:hypothetical protein
MPNKLIYGRRVVRGAHLRFIIGCREVGASDGRIVAL